MAMSDALATYLHDHLAGSNFAVELLESLHRQHAQEPLGGFAAALLVEIKQDREVVRKLITRAGGHGSTIKDAAAWLTEKIGRFKLTLSSAGELGTFEALEALSLGTLGKLALWRALSILAPSDSRVSGEDYASLIARAEDQHARLEERRLQMVPKALQSAPH
jgi:hypothetical protein